MAEATETQEIGNRARAERAFSNIDAPGQRMPNKHPSYRWGEIDGFAVIRSIVTGAVYMIDVASGSFYRTVSPGINRIMASTPVEVIVQDRGWLLPLLDTLPGGKACVQKYLPVSRAQAETIKMEVPHREAATRDPALASIKKVKTEKRITVTESFETIDLGAHQIVALLRLSGEVVPDAVDLSLENGYVRISWSKGTKEETS